MAAPPQSIRSKADLDQLRKKLDESHGRACSNLKEILTEPHLLRRLKFEKLGCDPLNADEPENLIEQVNQQATFEVALDALDLLMTRHPDKEWKFAPGAWADGPDIESTDKEVAAEVFAAVHPDNNKKLAKDIARATLTIAKHKYVIFRSPAKERSEWSAQGLTVISLDFLA